MKRLSITLISALAFLTASAQNQSDEHNRQVEVTKEYIPDVDRVQKLSIAPRMIDTTSLKPEIVYSIDTYPWLGSFGVKSMNPINISSGSFKEYPSLYIKAGIGYPLNSVFDSYYVGGDGTTSRYGVFINHRGDYTKIINDIGNSVQSNYANNKIGAFGVKSWGKLELGGEIGYSYDLVTDYGQFFLPQFPINTPLSASSIGYQTPTASMWFGNNFLDMDYLNFAINAGGYYLSDNSDAAEFGLNTGLKLGQSFAAYHTVMLNVDYDISNGKEELKGYENTTFRIAPQYSFKKSKLLLDLGLEVAVDNIKNITVNEKKTWVFPKVDLAFNILDKYLLLFLTADGHLQNNSYKNSVDQNPYMIAQLNNVPNSAFYDFSAGIKGNISPSLTYKLHIGYSEMQDYVVMANLYTMGTSGRFVYAPDLTDNGNSFTFGGQINGHVNNRFYYGLSANYYNYSMDRVEFASGLANYDAELTLKYAFSDALKMTIDAQLIGDRHFFVLKGIGGETVSEKVKPVVDVNAGLEYDVKKNATIFLEAHNIAGSNLYLFNHYPSVGLSCTMGVKLTF